MQSNVERLTKKILHVVNVVKMEAEDHGEALDYPGIVRGITNALVSVNETHRQAEL